ncbi:MAG: aminotransferase class V-fold PLP-dependent enzyme [Proteobacteria bacterium]|nr:aminotransferase class V-fold PLP-dependent enzyme [Pseudomonadota bacterium]
MITPDDIACYRAETRGTEHVAHLNNAGASLPPDAVHERVIRHLDRERDIGGYEAKAEAANEFEAFYPAIAGLIGAKPQEIAFIENATRAWDMAFYSLPFREGDEIITVETEYASNFMGYLQARKRHGAVIKVAPCAPSGRVDVAALEKLITSRTKLISVTHVPSHSGIINPAAEIGRIARQHGILFLLDACQSVGQLPVDVNEIGCDMLSATGRKFLRGPRGTGFLYVREELANSLEPVMLDLHAAEWTGEDQYRIEAGARRFENWECFFAGKLGLAVAARYAQKVGLAAIAERNTALAERLRGGLASFAHVDVRDRGEEKCAIVTFTVKGREAAEVHHALRQQGINTSVSSGDYSRLDLTRRGIKSLVRASVHYYNLENEIDRCIEAVARLGRG